MKSKVESVLLTPQEACSYLRVSSVTLYKMIKDGSIPTIKVGRQYRIRTTDLDSKRGDERFER